MDLQYQNLEGNFEDAVRGLSNYEDGKIYENMYMTVQVSLHKVQFENKQV